MLIRRGAAIPNVKNVPKMFFFADWTFHWPICWILKHSRLSVALHNESAKFGGRGITFRREEVFIYAESLKSAVQSKTQQHEAILRFLHSAGTTPLNKLNVCFVREKYIIGHLLRADTL